MIESNKLQILIVEDELLIAHSIKKMLAEKMECVGIAINYQEALHFLNLGTVDLVLIDITLSGDKTGLDLAKIINDEYQIPFIFLTSLTNNETLEKVQDLKPSAYLAKPVQAVNLTTAINLALIKKKDEIAEIYIGNQLYKINLTHLMFAESEHVYVRLVFDNSNTQLLRISLKELISKLPQKKLLRVNRSIAVNPLFITKISANSVYLKPQKFKISEVYKQNFK